MKKLLLLILLVSGYITPGISGTSSPQNGSGTLGSTYNVTKCGLSYVQASKKVTNRSAVGGTGSGLPCTLAISGLPAAGMCLVIEKAYLYYEISYMAGSPTSPAITVKNPSNVTTAYTATNIGSAGIKNWGEVGSRAFRTDVTSSISGNGNYVINTNTPADEIDGMTLIIIYSDLNATYQGSLLINDGIITKCASGAVANTTLSAINPCAAVSGANAFLIAGDFQFATHTATAGGASGVPVDAFWNFDNISVNLTAGQPSLAYSVKSDYIAVTDCFSLIVTGLYYKTTTCTTCGPCIIVPIELLSFNAREKNNNILLTWQTASEINNDHFEIERSTDGNDFQNIGIIKGAGNSNVIQSYSFSDKVPLTQSSLPLGKVYYRLKQTDYDGKSVYSKIDAVALPNQRLVITSSNPIKAGENIEFQYNMPRQGNIQVKLIDMTGRAVYLSKNNYNEGNNKITINNKGLQTGIYTLQIISEDNMVVRRLIVE